MKGPSKAITEAVEKATAALLSSLSDPDEATRQAVQRAAELRVLAQEARASALAGHPVLTADLLRLEDMANEAHKQLGIPDKPPVNHKLTIRYVGGAGCRANDLNLEEFEKMSALLRRIDTMPVETNPADLAEALCQVEALRRKLDESNTRICELERELAAATKVEEPPTLLGEILAPAKPRQLPAPATPDEPLVNHWAALGAPANPATAWSADNGYRDLENR